MRTCGQAKLLNQIWTNQVVATPTINYSADTVILDDEKYIEQIIAL
jgi:hypothetical protein